MFIKRTLCFLAAVLVGFSVYAQSSNKVPKKEVRGVWMATVINLDWPISGRQSVSGQKEDLLNKLDDLNKKGLNLVFFQVRTEGDALYDSDVEPWSKYLTGEEGKAPDPYWDPLEFAVKEAHKRGMELHAWLNPYRAMRTIPGDFTQDKAASQNEKVDESLSPFLDKEYDANTPMYKAGTSERDSKHVSNTHPEWLMVVRHESTGNESIAIFNPGIPQVRDYNLGIVMDIVNRYDVDGIHFDDYFYPYPPNHMGNTYNSDLDDSTFAKYPRGFTNKDDWRRDNINTFVQMVYDSIQVVKPWVKFGISPFGIWKSGTPTGTYGLSAYDSIFADGLAWLEAHSIDYITPQLYWPFDGGQDYRELSIWWADHAEENDRHIYPGHGLYRSDSNTYTGSLFKPNEITRQMTRNRNIDKIGGSVFFRTENITNYSSKGFSDSLLTNYYKFAALQPVMDWKDTTQPDMPENLAVSKDAEKEYIINISWDKPSDAPVAKQAADSAAVDTLIKYAVYRVDSAEDPDEAEEMEKYYNLVGVTGETSYTDIAPPSTDSYYYFVTAVSRNNVESEPTASENAGIVVSNEEESVIADEFRLLQNYPNPFNPTTEINFSMKRSGFATLKVYDMLGREVSTLVNRNLTSGAHSVTLDASSLSSGIYIYQLQIGSVSLTKKMTLIK